MKSQRNKLSKSRTGEGMQRVCDFSLSNVKICDPAILTCHGKALDQH